jgi:hypothetical protein
MVLRWFVTGYDSVKGLGAWVQGLGILAYSYCFLFFLMMYNFQLACYMVHALNFGCLADCANGSARSSTL